MIDRETLWANGNKPVRIAEKTLFIGDDEFPYPISEDFTVRRAGKKRNLLTITLLVGTVTIETADRPDRPPN